MSNLKYKTLSGLSWTVGRLFSIQLAMFLVQLVLARILMPEVFGLVAMLQVFIAIGQTLMDSGMTTSLIRDKDASQRDYSTVFYINLMISLFIYLIIYLNAENIGAFYNQPLLSSIVKVYAISIVIQAFIAVQLAKLTKEMNFKLQMLLEIPSVIFSCILGLWMAYHGYGVWSLVWMNLSKSIIFTIQVWLFSKWTPSWIFDWDRFKFHFNFGYKLTLSGILNTAYDNLYNLIIGKYYTATQLGFYDRASNLRNLPVTTISMALNKVTYPMFSAIQDDNIKLKETYRKIMQQILFWVSPMMILASIIAEPLFRLLLTEKWLPAVPYFQILCFSAIFYPLHAYNLNIVNVKGRSDIFLRLEVIKKIMITIVILLSLPFGIYGLLYAQLIINVLGFLINSKYSGSLINYTTIEQIKDIISILLLSLICGAFSWLINYYLLKKILIDDIINITANILIYGIFYLSLSFLLKLNAFVEFRKLIFKL